MKCSKSSFEEMNEEEIILYIKENADLILEEIDKDLIGMGISAFRNNKDINGNRIELQYVDPIELPENIYRKLFDNQ